MMISSKSMIILYGPTGVGKTDCALEIAERLNGEIINMDMGALYTALTIGTAKPDWKSHPISHHLFDVIDTPRNVTVIEYRTMLKSVLEDIWRRNKMPILVGGSGFYLKSIFFPPIDQVTYERHEYAAIPDTELWSHLHEIDSMRAQKINPHDLYRIKRALDIWYSTHIKPSSYAPKFEPLAPFSLFFLKRNRAELYERIDTRAHAMINAGWIDEVQSLKGTDWEQFIHAKKIIGYDDILHYLAHPPAADSNKKLIETIQMRTRNYAKRQFTFWRSLKKDLQDALAEYTDSDLVAKSSIDEIDVSHENCASCIERTVKNK